MGTKASSLVVPAKNYIHNGDFDFWQRGISSTTAYSFLADRWKIATGAGGTVSQQGDSVTPPWKLRIQSSSGSNAMWIATQLEYEDFKDLLGKEVTISALMSARNSNAPSLSPGFNLFYNPSTKDIMCMAGAGVGTVGVPNGYVIKTITTSPTLISHTFTMPSNALAFSITLGNFTSTLASGDGYDVHRVWMNAGSLSLPFQRAGLTYQGELALCQRYYEKSYPVDMLPASVYRSHQVTVHNSGNPQWIHVFKVTKFFLVPTIHCYSIDGSIDMITNDATTTNLACEGYFNPTPYGFTLHKTSMTEGHQVAWNWTCDAEFS
jgi:hypothetical protein